MNIFDRILNRNDYQMAPLQPVEGANSAGYMPDGRLAGVGMDALQGVQIDADGNAVNANIQPMRDTRPKNNTSRGQRIINYILGTPTGPADNVGQPIQNENGDVVINASINDNPRKGGLLNDFTAGYQDNRFNSLNSRNLQPNPNKSWANRFGEGVGSLARLAESPLGRGLMMAGLVNATGGDSLQALAYGAQAGVGNQTNRMQDRLYRQSLITSAQQSLKNNPKFALLSQEEQAKQLQDVENNIMGIRGYMNADTYGKLQQAQVLRDNAAWRKFYYENQVKNDEKTLEFKEREAERNQQNFNRKMALRDDQLDIQRARINAQQNKINSHQKNLQAEIHSKKGLIAQLDNIIDMAGKYPKATGIIQGSMANSTKPIFASVINNLSKDDEIGYRSAIANFASTELKDRSGAAVTLSEEARLQPYLPKTTDSMDTIIKKAKAAKKIIQSDIQRAQNELYDSDLNMYMGNDLSREYNYNDPLGIRG